jgi:hypothetical protein
LLAEHGHRIVRDEDFAECYSPRMGRPSIRPSLLAKVMLHQHRTGVSDEQAMEAVAWDLRRKVALGLAVDHRDSGPRTSSAHAHAIRSGALAAERDGRPRGDEVVEDEQLHQRQ